MKSEGFKNCRRLLKFGQSGDFSPNLVTLHRRVPVNYFAKLKTSADCSKPFLYVGLLDRQTNIPGGRLSIVISILKICFLKNGPIPASFSLFSSFQYTVDSKQMFN